MRWSDLSSRAKGFRIAHTAWSIGQLACLAYLWACAFGRRRDRPLAAAITFLGVEGLAVVIGHGDCPLGGLQRQWGDPVPLFELVLPPRAAKAAVPVLTAVSLAGLVAVAARPPRRRAPRRGHAA